MKTIAGKHTMMGARMLSEQEGWAVGGGGGQLTSEAEFYHTTDGGDTWDLSVRPFGPMPRMPQQSLIRSSVQPLTSRALQLSFAAQLCTCHGAKPSLCGLSTAPRRAPFSPNRRPRLTQMMLVSLRCVDQTVRGVVAMGIDCFDRQHCISGGIMPVWWHPSWHPGVVA